MKLPTFLIIGAQRSGTTALRKNLNLHPSIEIYDGEICFFQPKNYDKGLDWYLSHFKSHKEVIGEKCPMYMYKSQALKNIHATLPDIKLIAILREPVTRAISQYVKAIKTSTPNSKRSLDSIIDRDIKDVENGLMERSDGVLQRGIYSCQIKNVINLFNKNNLKIIIFEDLLYDSHYIYSSIFDFIEVSNDTSFITNDGWNVRLDGKLSRKAWSDIHIEDKTVDRLIDFYKPYNEILRTLIGRDLKEWEFD
ncbi:MAG: sulfotransferase [Microcoleaceae cyanobacterium]